MRYWVYENWRAHGSLSRVHEESCRHAKYGRGLSGQGTDPKNGRWHSFDTFREAVACSQALPGPSYLCKLCHPESN